MFNPTLEVPHDPELTQDPASKDAINHIKSVAALAGLSVAIVSDVTVSDLATQPGAEGINTNTGVNFMIEGEVMLMRSHRIVEASTFLASLEKTASWMAEYQQWEAMYSGPSAETANPLWGGYGQNLNDFVVPEPPALATVLPAKAPVPGETKFPTFGGGKK